LRKLFGTDGIRGVAGEYPLDQPTVYNIGVALAHHLDGAAKRNKVRVVVGQDTRESSGWIADTITSGLESAGAEVASAGVVTTPAVAYLAHTHEFSAGIVVSASHNPWQDNGIKIFGHDGYKLPDTTELEIEKEIFARTDGFPAVQPSARSLPGEWRLREEYEQWLAMSFKKVNYSGLRVVADCANGAASAVAPELFSICGIDAEFTHVAPDGRNINDGCGALHPEVVAREVVERKADVGICFDGDADRALFADHTGKVVNGDAVLLLAARELQARGVLKAKTVVATTMSNMGLEAALRASGIRMLRAPVGDKYVLEEMRKHGAILGGEQSGHIIFSERATTGDGLLTALKVLKIVASNGKKLSELVADLKTFPQVIKNVRVREKKPIDQMPSVVSAIREAEADLNDEGRVVVRYSGTESLCRVMIEAASAEKMNDHAERISAAMRKEVGA
jgi:phosphoglucosamine mutase